VPQEALTNGNVGQGLSHVPPMGISAHGFRRRLRKALTSGNAGAVLSVCPIRAKVDLGFDTQVLASMIDHLDAYTEVDLLLDPQITDIPALRAFFAHWAPELRVG